MLHQNNFHSFTVTCFYVFSSAIFLTSKGERTFAQAKGRLLLLLLLCQG